MVKPQRKAKITKHTWKHVTMSAEEHKQYPIHQT